VRAQAKNHQRQLQEILDELAALTDPKSSDGLRFRLDLYFGEVEIKGDHDFEAQDTLLDFEADEGLSYRVRVTREYDADYASGQVAVDLSIL
jgi:hypothetical protein